MHPIRPRFRDQISHTNCGPPSEVRKVHDSPYNVRHTSPCSGICVYFSRSTIYTKYRYVCCVCVWVLNRLTWVSENIQHNRLSLFRQTYGVQNCPFGTQNNSSDKGLPRGYPTNQCVCVCVCVRALVCYYFL